MTLSHYIMLISLPPDLMTNLSSSPRFHMIEKGSMLSASCLLTVHMAMGADTHTRGVGGTTGGIKEAWIAVS